jgi:hypothetical protein
VNDIERYAIGMILDGAASHTGNDLNEDGILSEEDHAKAYDLAMAVISAMRADPKAVLALVKS